MPFYAMATILLIRKLQGNSKQVWYADDAAAIGKITDLRAWWNGLVAKGPGYGYFANSAKTWLVTKEEHHANATSIFASTGVEISSSGRPYLGVAIGSAEFVEMPVKSKVNGWLLSVNCLTYIAKTQPHAAFSALTHGLSSKWIYLCRTISNISHLLKSLDDAISSDLLPALTGRPPPTLCTPSKVWWSGNRHSIKKC